MKKGDRVCYRIDILRGLGTVLAVSKSGKSALVQWPNPYNYLSLSKPSWYKLSNLHD
ncbi:hypothetical protein [Paenibacillus sp. VTT E-133291]|uniref:hypothetical protein n=1 Tax=Paenibacillus sp. VTT E-133291 TaxID=1986223 RepID=UPI0015C629C1|nr:hypothetical protein [Paenibacillus sp. VTT E-133291]